MKIDIMTALSIRIWFCRFYRRTYCTIGFYLLQTRFKIISNSNLCVEAVDYPTALVLR